MLERCIVTGDWHVPGHVERWLDCMFSAIIPAIKPDRIVINGDALTCDGVSQYLTPPTTPALTDEIAVLRPMLARMRRAAGPDCQIDFIQGNHEERLDQYLWKHPALAGLSALTWPALLALDVLDIRWHPYFTDMMVGPAIVSHGDTANKWGGYTASNAFRRSKHHLIVGHCHRLALVEMELRGGSSLVGAESGCGCNWRAQKYVRSAPDWQVGALLLTYEPGQPWLGVTPIQWHGTHATLGADVYRPGLPESALPPVEDDGAPLTSPPPASNGKRQRVAKPPVEAVAQAGIPRTTAEAILAVLRARGELATHEIAAAVGRDASNIGRHLRVLQAAGLVIMTQRATFGGGGAARWRAAHGS